MTILECDWQGFCKRLTDNEGVRYIIAGAVTTAVNFGLFVILQICGIPYLWANGVAIMTAKVTAYALNKWYVFCCHTTTWKQTLGELTRYIAARGATGLVDFFGLWAWVEFLRWPQLPGKMVVMIIVLVLNYVLGKKLVFTAKKKEDNDNNIQ